MGEAGSGGDSAGSTGSVATSLPESFLSRLRYVVGHFGVGSLDRTPELEEALLRLCIAHRRFDEQAAGSRMTAARPALPMSRISVLRVRNGWGVMEKPYARSISIRLDRGPPARG